MDPNLDSRPYIRPEYLAFTAEADRFNSSSSEMLTTEQFLSMSRKAVELKRKIPELREAIAYEMVCVGSKLKVSSDKGMVKEIHDLFRDLELPDAHIISQEAREYSDFSEVQQKWDRIETLLATRSHQ